MVDNLCTLPNGACSDSEDVFSSLGLGSSFEQESAISAILIHRDCRGTMELKHFLKGRF